jgi:hypothetical protein
VSATASQSRSATPAREYRPSSSGASPNRSSRPRTSATAPGLDRTSPIGSWCAATTGTSVFSRSRATPASRSCSPAPNQLRQMEAYSHGASRALPVFSGAARLRQGSHGPVRRDQPLSGLLIGHPRIRGPGRLDVPPIAASSLDLPTGDVIRHHGDALARSRRPARMRSGQARESVRSRVRVMWSWPRDTHSTRCASGV